MTPAIDYLRHHKIPFSLHEYQLQHSSDNYGQDVADALGVPHRRLFKTLLITLNGNPKTLAAALVPVSGSLNLKLAAKALGVKKAELADAAAAEKSSGYVLGGISPFGQKKPLPTLLDRTAMALPTMFTSGGRRGLQVEVKPAHLVRTLGAIIENISA
ncbi:aminoacyl-tRNA deacylase [Reinekea sp.]|jgi:Cys-tRNA(Pro)/Cys-tRNA(Cys) deacylase|uniref:aminoacyl-tRNA deacylase n=1 Tax=Reinekea sp. TaxID=1970455 RepID=UPI002A80E421|nr:aminoacyl-tRNA deacylase [Reinekea sp.]